MSKSRLIAAALLGLSLLVPIAPSAASAAARADSPRTTLRLETVGGSGCPTGTTHVATTPSGDAFTLLFDAFQASGSGIRNCQVVVRVGVPAGWTYTIYAVDNRGFALLDRGATGMMQMTTYFTGYPWTVRETMTLRGPYQDAWQTTNVTTTEQWAPCNTDRFLNINDVLSVSGPSSSSMAMFSKDVSVSTIFKLKWRSC